MKNTSVRMTASRMDINAGRMSDLEIRARAIMAERGISSVTALAATSGVSLASFHGWFRLGRQPGVVSRYKLQQVLGVDLWDDNMREVCRMTPKEHAEMLRLNRLWAIGKATRKQIERCMELERKSKAEQSNAND